MALTTTLSALIIARKKVTNCEINENSISELVVFRVYSLAHVHSSIDKTLKTVEIGAVNLVRIPIDTKNRNDP
jgi:aromatic-L-amino-acid decarboxylase